VRSWNPTDKLDTHLSYDLSKDDRELLMAEDPFACVAFWIKNKSRFPVLYEVALRILAIPASQCLSERALSAAANAQPANRDSLMPSSPNDILFKRSKADAEANLSPELRLKLFARDILPIRIEQVVNWNNSLPRLDETNFFVLSADVDDPS
jgi:hypothetical protein